MQFKYESSRRSFGKAMFVGAIGASLSVKSVKDTIAGVITKSGNSDSADSGIPFVSDKKFVPVMITPYQQNGQIDYKVLSQLTDFYLNAGAKGLFANCQSSEMYKLSDDERLSVTDYVVRHVNGFVPVVASGSFGKSFEDKAEFVKKIHQTGVDAVIIITNHFAKKRHKDNILIDNFEIFFALTKGVPLGTYECPAPYKRILTPIVFDYLIQSNRIIYHKDTTIAFDKVRVKIDMAKKSHLKFYDACTANTMRSLQSGASGMSSISGNFYPEILTWMCENATNPEKQEQVNYIQEQLTASEKVIASGYPLSSKYFLQKRGLPIQVSTRKSRKKLSKKQCQALDQAYLTFLGWCDYIGIEPVKI